MKRMLSSLLFIAVAVYVGVALALYLLQGRLVYYPTRDMAATPRTIGLDYEEVELRTRDGLRLHAWFIPAPGAERTLLFCHGNAGNISHRLESIEVFHRLGLNTLIFDYAGYGLSDGSPSERQTYRDAEAAWTHLISERGLAAEDIILFGRSLGGAVAAELAARHRPLALIMESSFTSVADLAAELYPIFPTRLLTRIEYPSIEHVTALGIPLLIVHSRHDEIIPFSHGERLFATASEPKQMLELTGGHNDGFIVSADRYVKGLAEFLASLPERTPSE